MASMLLVRFIAHRVDSRVLVLVGVGLFCFFGGLMLAVLAIMMAARFIAGRSATASAELVALD